MAGKAQTKRKDKDRIVLRKGESQRKNGTYHFSWTDKLGKRHFIYAPTLEELREKEAAIEKDKLDGIKAEARYVTVNEMFDLWCQLKRGLKNNTFENYKYMYNSVSASYVLPADKIATVKVGSTTVVEMHNELRDTPKTGDNSNVGLWTALAGLSALGIVGTAVVAYRKTFIPEYQELYLQNNDMVGWIKVEDTKINYPVMQSKDNPNFYLKHGFDKAYTDYGCPYVQENCDMELPSDNIIIYGHHMNDGSMFAGLMKFKDKNFWEKHKTISFDTLTDRQTYEVIAVFKTVVYTNSPDSFKYYQFVNAETAEDFTAYVEKCKELSLYDTGVTAEYGDKLLTLSTCEYSRTNGRLVVVAKLINE